jgi:pimeloyl-ACP methyl ester carboxylesterase
MSSAEDKNCVTTMRRRPSDTRDVIRLRRSISHNAHRTRVTVNQCTGVSESIRTTAHTAACRAGNPGVCEFYYDFADALHRLLNGECGNHRCLALSVTAVAPLRCVAFSLDDQVAHKRHLLRALLGESDDAERVFRDFGLPLAHAALPLMLAGHSIGAFVCFKLLAERGATCRRVSARHCAHADVSQSLRRLGAVCARRCAARRAPSCLPPSSATCPTVSRWLMHYSHGMSDESKYATADKLCYDFVNNVLYMAHTETLQVTAVASRHRAALCRRRRRRPTLFSLLANRSVHAALVCRRFASRAPASRRAHRDDQRPHSTRICSVKLVRCGRIACQQWMARLSCACQNHRSHASAVKLTPRFFCSFAFALIHPPHTHSTCQQ